MVIKFDKFNMVRKPNIILCNPSGEELYALSGVKDRVATLRYNSVSEFSFTAIEKNSKGSKYEYYDLIQTTRVVKLLNIAEFVITNVVEVDNGIYKTKDVTCKSLEFDISQKGISIEEGTYKFYDSVNPDKTIMNFIMEMLPDWELGSIDSSLWNLYRTFEVIDKNVYEFMMSDVEEAFECVFIFDTVAKTISVKAIKNAVKETDIFLSHKNVVKNLDITEDSEQIKTGLNIYGADDVTIRSINPLGGTTIYNFDYYKTTDWMPQDLIDAINAWEDKIEKATTQNKGILSNIKRVNGELLSLTTQLTELNGQLKSLENIKAVRMEQGLDITDVNRQIAEKQSEINAKEKQITNKEEELKRLKSQQSTLSNELALERNFTKAQYKILTKFIKVGKYQNDTFVITDSMTEVEKQEVLEELFEVGKDVLARVSQPKYTFNMEAVNFLNLFKYKKISQELELGSQITLGMNSNFRFAYPVLLEMTINYDDESDITLGFGNSLRLDKSDFTLAELFKEAVNVSSDVSFNKGKWAEGIKAKNQFNDYLNGSLNASLQEIINSDYQDILIDGSGIRCRRFNPNTNSFDPEQLWITGKSMVFSDDSFQTAKTALGRIRLPDGTYGYGINSEVILGKLIAGGQLVIENEGGTFMVDANGVTLKNANILITNDSGKEESLTDKMANDLSNAIDGVYQDIDEMNKALEDGMIDIFYQDTEPKVCKEGDLWYDTSKKNQAFLRKGGKWVTIQDQKIIDALESAQNAQATADGKITSYYSELPPQSTADKKLSEGDIWINIAEKNKQYRYTNGKWQPIQDGAISDLAKKTSKDLSDAVNEMLQAMQDADQALADGMLETFYTPTEPSGAKLGDLWFNTKTGKLYRHNGSTTASPWTLIEDAKITEAIEKAQDAQTTADGKITSYYQNEPPVGTASKPLAEGDLWVDLNDGNRLYRYSVSKKRWIDIHDSKLDAISKDLSDAIINIGNQMGNLEEALRDSMIDIFYQDEKPATAKEGDLWYDTNDKNKAYIYKQGTWVTIQDQKIIDALNQAQSAQTTADGKITSYYTNTKPTVAQYPKLSEGDIWIDTGNGNKPHRYTNGSWVSIQDEKINQVSKQFSDAVNGILSNIEDINQAIADGMIDTFYQPTTPTGKYGDLWFNTSTGKLYRHNGNSSNPWQLIEDAKITEAIDKAQSAQTTADGKITTYYLSSFPTTSTHQKLSEGDILIHTGEGFKQYRYTSGQWKPIQDKAINQISKDLATAVDSLTTNMQDMESALVDKMIVTYYESTQPSKGKVGDLWFNTSTGRAYRHNGTQWVLVQDKQLEQALRNAQNAQDTADKKIVSYYCKKNELPASSQLGRGDLWFDTADKNHPHRWVGNAWESLRDGTISDAQNTANNALNKVESVTNSKGELLADKLYGQILAGKNNIECINPDNNKILKMNEAGIMIANSKTNGNWNWKTAITGDGIVADYIKANSTMTSVNFRGGTLDIGSGKFTVSSVGACVASDLTIKGGSIAIGSAFNVDRNGNVTINGGTINLGSGKFKVDTFGNVTATSINISGAGSVLDAKDMTVRNLVVGGNVIMGANATISWGQVASKPNDLAYQGDIPTNSEIKSLANAESKSVLSSTYGITSTTIGRSSISSPNITGGTITGSRLVGGEIYQQSTNSRYSDGELIGGRLQFKKGGSYYGAVMGDAQDGKMWLEGNKALKLNAVEGDISINPRSKYGETANGTIYLYGRVVVRGGEIVDENNVPITGSAKFG